MNYRNSHWHPCALTEAEEAIALLAGDYRIIGFDFTLPNGNLLRVSREIGEQEWSLFMPPLAGIGGINRKGELWFWSKIRQSLRVEIKVALPKILEQIATLSGDKIA